MDLMMDGWVTGCIVVSLDGWIAGLLDAWLDR